MRRIGSRFSDTPNPSIPQVLVYQLFRLLIEAPLKKTKETTEVFLQQFRHSQQITTDQGDYSTITVAIGFGKGERALVELINIIDIALGDAEGKLSRNKVAILRRILEACYKERNDEDENENGGDGGSNGSGGGSNDDPNGGAVPIEVGSS